MRDLDGPQAKHSQLPSCLHFLKQEVGKLQVRRLWPASCLLSEMEVTAETRITGFVSCGHLKATVMAGGERG